MISWHFKTNDVTNYLYHRKKQFSRCYSSARLKGLPLIDFAAPLIDLLRLIGHYINQTPYSSDHHVNQNSQPQFPETSAIQHSLVLIVYGGDIYLHKITPWRMFVWLSIVYRLFDGSWYSNLQICLNEY